MTIARFKMPKRHAERVPISLFKTKTLALLEQVRRTGGSIVVTKRGKPIAEVIPPSTETVGNAWIGSMRCSAKLRGNLVAPAGKSRDWEALALRKGPT